MKAARQRMKPKKWEIGAVISILTIIASIRGRSSSNASKLDLVIYKVDQLDTRMSAHLEDVDEGQTAMQSFKERTIQLFAKLGVDF